MSILYNKILIQEGLTDALTSTGIGAAAGSALGGIGGHLYGKFKTRKMTDKDARAKEVAKYRNRGIVGGGIVGGAAGAIQHFKKAGLPSFGKAAPAAAPAAQAPAAPASAPAKAPVKAPVQEPAPAPKPRRTKAPVQEPAPAPRSRKTAAPAQQQAPAQAPAKQPAAKQKTSTRTTSQTQTQTKGNRTAVDNKTSTRTTSTRTSQSAAQSNAQSAVDARSQAQQEIARQKRERLQRAIEWEKKNGKGLKEIEIKNPDGTITKRTVGRISPEAFQATADPLPSAAKPAPVQPQPRIASRQSRMDMDIDDF